MEVNKIYHGNCIELAEKLDDASIRLVACSPPYAMQRKSTYGGILEKEYPQWTVKWMEALRPKLTEDASVFIVIRPHLKHGQISDYVLRTRLAVREAGWIECEEIIWHKPDAPPLGSIQRPRRTWESILWYSRTNKPFMDLKACGTESTRLGSFAGSDRFGEGGDSPIHAGQKRGEFQKGISRSTDMISVTISSMDRGVNHPAMYPQGVPNHLIASFSEKEDIVLDPFAGSGQTGISAKVLGRNFIGFEINENYTNIGNQRIENTQRATV